MYKPLTAMVILFTLLLPLTATADDHRHGKRDKHHDKDRLAEIMDSIAGMMNGASFDESQSIGENAPYERIIFYNYSMRGRGCRVEIVEEMTIKGPNRHGKPFTDSRSQNISFNLTDVMINSFTTGTSSGVEIKAYAGKGPVSNKLEYDLGKPTWESSKTAYLMIRGSDNATRLVKAFGEAQEICEERERNRE